MDRVITQTRGRVVGTLGRAFNFLFKVPHFGSLKWNSRPNVWLKRISENLVCK